MNRVLIRSARIWDSSAAGYRNGDVLIEDRRISEVSAGGQSLRADDAREVDATGLTLMPGLVEGHAHLSFTELERQTDLGELPPEEHLLVTMRNARLLLDHGFTSAYGAGSAKLRLDVVIRNEINAGRLAGPRMRAAGPEITVTGGLGDENLAHLPRSSYGLVVDGPEEMVKAVRICIREAVDNIKINISGDDTVAARASMTVMSEAEVRAATETAHAFGRRVNGHARSAEAVKRALRNGVDVIYHCEQADEEALDLLEAARDRVFVSPAIGPIHALQLPALADICRTYAQIRRRGIRTVIGGDYGLSLAAPQGANARDIELFVRLLGYSPAEALTCATRTGAEIMGMPDELGLIRAGYLADLLLVRGDPLANPTVLQHQDNLVAIMKDGSFHKNVIVT